MAGKIIKYVLLGLLVLVVAVVIYALALANGKVPLPKGAAVKIAESMGISQSEKEQMEKALDVYNILQKSEISDDVVKLRKMAMRGASGEEVAVQLQQSYESLSDDTLEQIRDRLEITPDDFREGKGIIDRAMESYAASGEFALSPEDRKTLEDLGRRYGLPEEAFDSMAEGRF